MKRPLPPIAESAEELKAQMQQATERLPRQRLHMLYLLASGQASTRQKAAELLGLHRNTIGRWLGCYEEGGLSALLEVNSPPGAVPAVNPVQEAALREALAAPQGFASYGAIQDWLADTFGIQMEYQAVHKLVRYKLGAKLKVVRPSHLKKNPQAVAEFRDSLGTQLSTRLPRGADQTLLLPVAVWFFDESRFGLQTIKRRRLTLRGVKPVAPYQHQFQNFYVYGAVAPRSGEGYFETRLSMGTADFQGFLDQFAAEHPERFHIMLLDNAASHHAKALVVPPNIALLHLPPYAPELNPCERVWQAIKAQLAWRVFDDLIALQDAVAERVEGYDEAAFASLIAYPFLCDAIDALAA